MKPHTLKSPHSQVHLKFKVPEYGREIQLKQMFRVCALMSNVHSCFIQLPRRHFIIRGDVFFSSLSAFAAVFIPCDFFSYSRRSFRALKPNWQFKAIS